MTRPDRSDKGLFGRMASEASDRVFDIVDPNLVLDHVDVDALIQRVDMNALLERVDINALMERIDIDALMERVSIEALVARAGIPEIVAESTSHLTGSALDFFRRPIVGLDEIMFRALNRLIGRDPTEFPQGPGELPEVMDQQHAATVAIKTGRYAGPLTRLLAFAVDSVVVTFGFTLLVAGVVFVIRLFAPEFAIPAESGIIYSATLVVWAFSYLWFSYAVFGKTIGKMILGVRVVSSDGKIVLKGRQSFLRVLTYPLSFILLGIGMLGIVFNRERRAWHDHFAGTAVVYDWGSRSAGMPTPLADYLSRKGADV